MNRMYCGLSVMVVAALNATPRALGEDKKTEHYPQVELKTTLGDITIELDDVRAPKSSENFLRYVREKFYDGLVFHRVIPSYVVQGGRFDALMKERTDGLHDPIPCEWRNGLKNERGTIGVARGSKAESGKALFYFNVQDNAVLDEPWPGSDNAGYAVFGRIVQGLDVLDAIAKAQTVLTHEAFPDERWVVPAEPIIILKAIDLSAAGEPKNSDPKEKEKSNSEDAAKVKAEIDKSPPTKDKG